MKFSVADGFFWLCFFTAIGSSFLAGFYFESYYHTDGDLSKLSERLSVGNFNNVSDVISSCDSFDNIDGKLFCALAFVEDNYQYVVRDDSDDVSFDVLLEEGGDCRNWSQFWSYLALQLNLSSRDVVIGIDDDTAHRFSVISSEEGYCVADQLELNCFIYGRG